MAEGLINYAQFLEKQSFDKVELLAMAQGNLVQDPPAGGVAQLPAPPFLMFDRITALERGSRKGRVVAEQDIHADSWYFQCHFRNDPVQPGCLGVDALWQLLGFYCAASGAVGSGRALGCKEVEFNGQIRPFDRLVRYELDVRRFSILKDSGAALAIAHGHVFVDDQLIYKVRDAKVGIFRDIAYKDYPQPDSPEARGGLLERDGGGV